MAPDKLENQAIWPENGPLKYNAILQVPLFCEREGKRGEVPFVQMFTTLFKDLDLKNSCRVCLEHSTWAAGSPSILSLQPYPESFIRDESCQYYMTRSYLPASQYQTLSFKGSAGW